ncbi:hypothetical protein T484DRAFT_1939941 [Baffinella frigidus]|nr:hypothetical protein T484DRAFT_1939941 [Cryptophyta sp. CCMP2293]
METEDTSVADALRERLDQGKTLKALKPAEAEAIFASLVGAEGDGEDFNKVKEQAVCLLAEIYADQKRIGEIQALLVQIRPFFASIPKAKTAKIVRTLIELVAKVPGAGKVPIQLCIDTVEWCRQEKRSFLRHRIQAKLASMYFESKDFVGALALVGDLLSEVKKLDDKPLLVEIHLVESRTHHQVRNHPRAKAALTAARTAANAIYCPPILQAQIDTQAGTLHAEEKDYKTAYSYFYEAYESFNNLEDPRALYSLKHMLLCKVLTNSSEEVPGLIDGKSGLKYAGADLEAMRDLAAAYSTRSLEKLIKTQETYKKQIEEDPVAKFHLTNLYDQLLEQNLARLVEPFSQVQISHIAELIKLPIATVEATLSQMILDKKFNGILDQGAGALIAYESDAKHTTLEAGLETIENMGKVVNSLYKRAAKLS